MTIQEPNTVGLTKTAHDKLKRLKDDGHFGELQDAYRLAISLAVAQGIDPASVHIEGSRTTIFNVGTLDPDQSLKIAINAIYSDACENEAAYKVAERLAEWGVSELAMEASRGDINFVKLLQQANEKLNG
jgi:hypothetical protein